MERPTDLGGWPRSRDGRVPLGHAHINMLGRYALTPPAGTGLRPLRDPDRAEDD